jgi:hypothetical protein
MHKTLRARLLAAGALLASVTLAQAQYMWIDEKGLKQFSDRAPPASIPLKHILKAPRGAASAQTAPAETVVATPQAAPSVADRNADYRKRAKESAEREQKEKDEQSARADQADNCERARSTKRTIASGVRIGTQDNNGERGVMTDAQRALEARKADKVLAACK